MKIKRNAPVKKKKKDKNLAQKIILDNRVRIPFPYHLENEVRAKFTMRNPEYLEICKRRRLKAKDRPLGHIITKEKKDGKWTSRKVYEWIYYWDYDGSELVLPRGSFNVIKKIFAKNKVKYRVIDKRQTLDPVDFSFKKKLLKSKGQHLFKPYSVQNGILQAGTGTGKTVMSLYHAARIKQPTIIVVDTNELLEQWKERIQTFYGIPIKEIGHIGGGKAEVKKITVALMQTLREKTELLSNFGMMIVDECHITPTGSYQTIINNFHGRYVMGLSATPRRKDGFTRVMFWLLGSIHIKISRKDVEKLPATGIFVITPYEGVLDFRKAYAKAKVEMLQDEERNQLIVDNIVKHIDTYGIHLIISSSSQHLEKLMEMMPHHFRLTSKLLVGKVKKEERKKIVQKAMKNELKFIFATDKLIGKGFDEELMSVLHIPYPVADPDAIEQLCGRVTRVPINKEVKALKKRALIFYYFDNKENTLRGAASTCAKKFKELGIAKQIERNVV